MGRSIKISIRGREFPSQKAAANYFTPRKGRPSRSLTEGTFLDELSAHCSTSLDLEQNGRNFVTFVDDYELRQNRQYSQYFCYKVWFSNQELLPFSLDKAVTVVFNAVN